MHRHTGKLNNSFFLILQSNDDSTILKVGKALNVARDSPTGRDGASAVRIYIVPNSKVGCVSGPALRIPRVYCLTFMYSWYLSTIYR